MPWWGNHNLYNFRLFENGGMSFLSFIIPITIWATIWKGLALYRAARNEQKAWFVFLLILNTAGIFEIVYLLFFSKPALSKKKKMKIAV